MSREEFFPSTKEEYKKRNETYFRDWNLRVLEILQSELLASKGKFKKTDDFDFDACLAWISSLAQKLPSSKEDADNIIKEFDKQQMKVKQFLFVNGKVCGAKKSQKRMEIIKSLL